MPLLANLGLLIGYMNLKFENFILLGKLKKFWCSSKGPSEGINSP